MTITAEDRRYPAGREYMLNRSFTVVRDGEKDEDFEKGEVFILDAKLKGFVAVKDGSIISREVAAKLSRRFKSKLFVRI